MDKGFQAIANKSIQNDKMQYSSQKFVHIIPHSHTDLGWQSTIDDYFEGKNLDFYMGSIKEMFDTVTHELA